MNLKTLNQQPLKPSQLYLLTALLFLQLYLTSLTYLFLSPFFSPQYLA